MSVLLFIQNQAAGNELPVLTGAEEAVEEVSLSFFRSCHEGWMDYDSSPISFDGCCIHIY